MELQNRNTNASVQKALNMVQQKKLSLAALKAHAQASLAENSDEIVKILDKDLEAALCHLHKAESDLTQILIGQTDEAHLEGKVQALQELAMKFEALKRPCLVCTSQDDCRYIGTEFKLFHLSEDHSSRWKSWIQDH